MILVVFLGQFSVKIAKSAPMLRRSAAGEWRADGLWRAKRTPYGVGGLQRSRKMFRPRLFSGHKIKVPSKFIRQPPIKGCQECLWGPELLMFDRPADRPVRLNR